MKISIKCIILVLLSHVFVASAQARPEGKNSHRESFGDTRAAIMESLLQLLFPAARFRWAPELQVQERHGLFVHAQFPGLKFGFAADGSLYGASGIELADKKEQAIFNARQHRQNPAPYLPTLVAVFRADAEGNVTEARKFELDPTDPLAEIKILRVSEWPKGSLPILEVRYVSHLRAEDSYAQIEWQSAFDTSSSRFIGRLPLGIVTKSKTGSGKMIVFSIHRISPTQVEMTDTLSNTTTTYSCSDPCVVDGPTLLANWSP